MLAMQKRKPGRHKAAAPKDVIHVEVPPELKAAIRELAGRNKRKLTAEVTLALENHVADAGLWPPPAQN